MCLCAAGAAPLREFSSMPRRLLSFCFCAGIAASAPAFADEGDTADAADAAAVAATSGLPSATGVMQPGWRNQWGVGAIANPRFVGGDEYATRVIPYVELRYFDATGTRFFANVPQGIGGYAYRYRDRSGGFFNVGMSVAPGFNVRDDSIEGLDEVGLATEARLLLEAGGRRWTATANIAQDVGNGHEGAYLDLSVNYRGRLKGTGFYAFGPVLRYGDSVYKDSLFGVSPQDAIETGLPAYDADAGLERAGLQGLLSLPLRSTKWRFTAVARVSRLFDNAADSPIVVDKTQYFFITALTRPF